MHLLSGILEVVAQIFHRAKHLRQLWVVKSHPGTRLAVLGDDRLDNLFIWKGSCVRAHTALQTACVFRACMVDHALHL